MDMDSYYYYYYYYYYYFPFLINRPIFPEISLRSPKGETFLQAGCPSSCHPTNSVKALF